MWRVLRRQGVDIGREHTARLMRSAGLSGKGKGGAPITTRKPKGPDLRPDLVNREFKAPGPNRLWVADDGASLSGEEIRELCAASLKELAAMGAYGADALAPVDRLRKRPWQPGPAK